MLDLVGAVGDRLSVLGGATSKAGATGPQRARTGPRLWQGLRQGS